MKKYGAYKPSGVDWIGEVPMGWEECRFKNFLTLINKPAIGGCKIGLENIESGSGKFIPSDSEFEGNGVEFISNDIVYGKLRPYLMKVWVAEFAGNAVGDFFVFRVKEKANTDLIKYLILSDGFTKEADGATEGAKMPRVSSDFILTLRYFLPSKEEQTAIAAYLDAKCAKIDNVVAVQQKRIELLKELKQSIITHAVTKGLDKNAKMKPSGVEWIGDVPEGWEIKKIKHNFRIYAGATPKTENSSYWDGDIVWITPADYKTNDKFIMQGERNITKEGYNSCNTQIVPKGSIIFSKRAPIGTVALNGVELCTNQGCLSCVPMQADSLYFYYVISICTEMFDMLGSGATFKEISADTFANVKFPVPSLVLHLPAVHPRLLHHAQGA